MGESIDFKDVFRLIKRRALIILLVGVLGALTSGVVTYYVLQPTYESSTQLLINRTPAEDDSSANISQLQADLTMMRSYQVMITSPVILDKVIAELELSESPEELGEQITVSSEAESQIIQITVQDDKLEQSVELANTIASTFQKEVVGLMNVDNVNILTESTVGGSEEIEVDALTSIIIAFIGGLAAGTILVFIVEYFDRTLKSEKEAEQLLGLPVLVTIGSIDKKKHMFKELQEDQSLIPRVKGRGTNSVETQERAN
ncbi:YveK family protein [Halobacillus kuroshimensis]|uniref:YveK family protein n=1 Tax=Halobacillus kuroshimensis TaxID=302481 RepID=UPI0004264A7D|nr:Wzz/FepE/Etk N-terminal domain-containing protein [Halobacillus kuroshimensis]